jgi:hypothetical protein
VPHLLEQALDPALARRLEVTVEAIEALRGEKEAKPRERWVGNPFRQITFTGVDREALWFIQSPSLQPAVSFGCVVSPRPFEDALEKALQDADPVVRAQALALLLRVRSPSTVPAQRKVLTELGRLYPGRAWQPIRSRMESCFDPRDILRVLGDRGLENPFSASRFHLWWSIRAAGVMKVVEAIPRLRELSVSPVLYTSLAAERSLEDFDGPEADEALGHCLLAWRYDAYVQAGSALAKRNKPYLRDLLSRAPAPDDCLYWQAILLARCDSTESLPLLVSKVGEIAIIDGEMFEHMERLAESRHRELIESLPGRVRPDQAEDARRVVSRFNERFPIEHGKR